MTNQVRGNGVLILNTIKRYFDGDYVNIKIRVATPGMWTTELYLDDAIEHCRRNANDVIHFYIQIQGLGRLHVKYDCHNPERSINRIEDLNKKLNYVRSYWYE